jgi:hypothetical protein
MSEQLEPEVLSYREFRKRETLLAWERRRRAFESQPGRWSERGSDELLTPPPGLRPGPPSSS